MSETNDGGPALNTLLHRFADCIRLANSEHSICETVTAFQPQVVALFPGESLRDRFARQALVGLLSNATIDNGDSEGYAKAAYRFADAMLSARSPVGETES